MSRAQDQRDALAMAVASVTAGIRTEVEVERPTVIDRIHSRAVRDLHRHRMSPTEFARQYLNDPVVNRTGRVVAALRGSGKSNLVLGTMMHQMIEEAHRAEQREMDRRRTIPMITCEGPMDAATINTLSGLLAAATPTSRATPLVIPAGIRGVSFQHMIVDEVAEVSPEVQQMVNEGFIGYEVGIDPISVSEDVMSKGIYVAKNPYQRLVDRHYEAWVPGESYFVGTGPCVEDAVEDLCYQMCAHLTADSAKVWGKRTEIKPKPAREMMEMVTVVDWSKSRRMLEGNVDRADPEIWKLATNDEIPLKESRLRRNVEV